MSIICSWCGSTTSEMSSQMETICVDCAEKAGKKPEAQAQTVRVWQSWMPSAPYPNTRRGDTRR